MDKFFEVKYHKVEESNWWFKARRKMILSLLKDHKKSRILDIGCASGALIRDLIRNGYSDVCAVDISSEAVKLCKSSGLKNVHRMDASAMDFKDGEFDVIIASDILEHIKDDLHALKQWQRILKREGRLIVFVPTFDFLWSDHDTLNRHYRRYSKKRLVSVVRKAGFKIKRNSYWNFTLFLPIAIFRLSQKFLRSLLEREMV